MALRGTLAAWAGQVLGVIGMTDVSQAITIPGGSNTHTTWIDIRGLVPVFGTDVAFAGTDITFLHSFDGTNSAGVLKDGDGNTVTLTGAATTVQTLIPVGNDAVALAAAYYIQIVKGTAQGAAAPTVITVGKSS